MKHLILLHGALGHTTNFDPYLPWLSEHFKVHTFLFEGHGGVPLLNKEIRIKHYVSQLERYIEEQRLFDVHIFGYSMGGYVALCYALEFPQRISSILTLATKLNWTEEGALKESKMLNPEVIAEKVPKYAAQLAQLHGEEHWQMLLPAVADMMIHLGKKPMLDADNLKQLNLPIQLMIGDKDAMVTLEETLNAAKAIPNATLAVLPNSKHPIEQIRPQLLLDLMKDFWKIVDGN